MSSNDTLTTAEVTITTSKDGKTATEKKVFTGTDAEVKAQIEALKDAEARNR
jgi:K(+)-stimulated pyrophosphate-energized sodium pump